MIANSIKATAPGRDNQLLAKLEIIASQPHVTGFIVNREGWEAVKTEVEAVTINNITRNMLFGVRVFKRYGQPQRCITEFNSTRQWHQK